MVIELGQIVATPGALEAMTTAGIHPGELLNRHANADWGDVCAEDKALNDQAVRNGERVLSAYTLSTGVRVWLITEWDRSSTCALLPEEY